MRRNINRWDIQKVEDASRRFLNLNNLQYNVTYYIRVSAFNAKGEGPVTEPLPVIVLPGGE